MFLSYILLSVEDIPTQNLYTNRNQHKGESETKEAGECPECMPCTRAQVKTTFHKHLNVFKLQSAF